MDTFEIFTAQATVILVLCMYEAVMTLPENSFMSRKRLKSSAFAQELFRKRLRLIITLLVDEG